MPEPILVRKQLGRELRRLRGDAGRTDQEVADARLASRSKLWRIEHGKTPLKVADVRALCWYYGVSRAETEALVELAIGSNEYSWWEQHGNAMPGWFRLAVGLESTATAIRIWEPEAVPGLFQTHDYAATLYQAYEPDADPERIKQQVQLRIRRQHAVFGRDKPPTIIAVLGELVVARQISDSEVHAAQLRKLHEVADVDHVELRVLPWKAGAHPAMDGKFHVFECDNGEDPHVAYTESAVGSWYHEKQRDLTQYRTVFDRIYNQSIPFEEYTA